MALTKIGTDIIADDAITADKIAAGALDTQLAGYLSTNSFATETYVGTTVTNAIAPKWTQDNTKISNWDTAYGWGNHASVGYTTTDTTYSAGTGVTLTGTTFSLTDTAAKWTEDNTKISNWDTAYGWGDHSTATYATQSYVGTALSNLVDSSPATLDTLNELAAALGDDPSFATTVTNSIGLKAPIASPSFTGTVQANGRIRLTGAGVDEGSGINLWSTANGPGFLAGYELGFYTGPNSARTSTLFLSASGAATFSGSVALAGSSAGLSLSDSATADNTIQLITTGGYTYVGANGSAGNRFIGSSAYASTFGTTAANALELATANTVRMTISSTGAATFSGNVGVGTTALASTQILASRSDADISNAHIRIEQGGAGDAYQSYLLSGVQWWSHGIDNSDGNNFVLAANNDLVSNRHLVITPTGAATFSGTVTVGGPALLLSNDNQYVTFNRPTTGDFGYIGTGSNTTGGAATDLGIRAENNLILGAGGYGADLTIASTGAATFGGTLASGGITTTGNTSAGAASAGDGRLFPNNSYGAFVYGNGTIYDVALGQRSTGVALGVLAGTTNVVIPTGNVGIGTDAPAAKLDVKSQLNMTNSDNVSLLGLKATRFGYSSNYKVLQIGSGAATTSDNLAIGVDLSTNASGSFTGYGEAIYFRNGVTFRTPNSANDGFHTYTTMKDGNVGIGIDAPAGPLHLYQAVGGVNTLTLDTSFGSGNAFAINPFITGVSNGGLSIRDVTNGADRLVIQYSTGNVGIGTSLPNARLHTNLAVVGSLLPYLNGTTLTFDTSKNIIVTHDSAVIGTDTAAGLLLVNNNNSNNAISPIIAFSAKSASTSYNHTYAAIWGQKTATAVDANWNQGSLVFATTNFTGPLERMRIDASGNLLVGCTALDAQRGFAVEEGPATNIQIMHNYGEASGTTYAQFLYATGAIGSIIQSGTTGVTYVTTSDLRLKKDIKPINNPTQKLLSMNPVTHSWINDPDAKPVVGFIAQEMMNIVPEAISGTPEGEEMMGMDYGRITPIIVAALQEALKEIEELKTRISKMENK